MSTLPLALLTLLAPLPAFTSGPQAPAGWELHVPPTYTAGVPMPLVILLHGYGANGAVQEAYMRFSPLADEFGFLFLNPNGDLDSFNNRFWNATDACCDFNNSGIDHSGILRNLIDTTKADFDVDDRRVFLVGHSNGGFMSYRMACDHADAIAAIATLAGASFDNPADCMPSEPVHVLQIHGTDDATILYGGGNILGVPYPAAVESVENWATYDGCDLTPDHSAPDRDLDRILPGDETVVTRYTSACAPGGSTELWTIQGGAHVPDLVSTFSRQVVEWFYAHPKPGAGTNYCQSTANSSGVPAVMDVLGSASITSDDLVLVANDVPAGQSGLFYYGPEQLSAPFGNGTRCVGAGGIGVFRLPILNSGTDGVLFHALDYASPPRPAGQITPGSTWNFQAWFRDPPAGGAFFDLSDGVSISFLP